MVDQVIKKPPTADVWNQGERVAWMVPPPMKPSEWAERYRIIRRGSRKGPWRNANAPYLRGIMDISVCPGVVQVNLLKAGRIGGSEAWRTLLAYWAHTDPGPVGMTLPSRDKGRSIIKTDILPLFRRTPVLRELIGSSARDMLIESMTLLNGFSLELMWAGSPTSTASSTFQRVGNDEVDIFEQWTGDQPDAITATEGRITTYEDRRLQFNCSTPTTTAGQIHRLHQHSTVRLEFRVPCPHCGHRQALRWGSLKYMDLQCAELSLKEATAAAARGELRYGIVWNDDIRAWEAGCGQTASVVAFDTVDALGEHQAWLSSLIERLRPLTERREVADVLATERERAIWYECSGCHGRITHGQKTAMVREGWWTSAEGFVVDYWGQKHEDAEKVLRWPVETRVGFAINAMYCTWVHWGLLVREWLCSQGDPAALFFFTTFRLGEAFEYKLKRLPETVFSAKCTRATLAAGIVPRWAWILLATIDTQIDHLYCVIRAWGGGMRSARIWHGKLMTFDDLDRLLFAQQWPVEGGEFPPKRVARALIDSGGTSDRFLDLSRTLQVYQYAILRQIINGAQFMSAIKGASKPGPGIYWPMKNPMSEGGKVDLAGLRAIMIDTHKANDMLGELITGGLPSRNPAVAQAVTGNPVAGQGAGEVWLLNKDNDAEYNAHMAAMQRTVDPKTKAEIWTPRSPGVRHDYRDCEAYQVAAAYICHVHLLPEEAEVIEWNRQLATPPAAPPQITEQAGGGFDPQPL